MSRPSYDGWLFVSAGCDPSDSPRPAEAMSAINELGVVEASKRLDLDQSTVYSFIDELEFRVANPGFRFETPGGDAK